jgi:glycosyltransferase involved in cell wall biosynthesis
LKILCLNYEYPPIGGGGGNVAHPLAVALRARGHSIDVLTSGMPDLPVLETVDGIDIHRVRCRRKHRHYTTTAELLTYIWPTYRKACQLHAEQRYDINHTHFALPSGLVSYLLFKKTGLPYAITIHGSDVPGYNVDRFQWTHRLVAPVWRRVIANSTRIISASRFLKDLIQSHMDVPVQVVPNGFDGLFGSTTQYVKRNRILVVTRMFRRKGVQHFVEALAGVNHDWEVVIAGDGPYLPELKEQVRRLGIHVSFVGFVQGETLAELYGTSKIFVFPSLQENFPTVLLEAMQAGCAIITTNAQGCGEVVGNAGIAVAPERPDQIREAMISLLNDDNKITNYRDLATARIKRFRWKRIAEQYDNILCDPLPRRVPATADSAATAIASRRQ